MSNILLFPTCLPAGREEVAQRPVEFAEDKTNFGNSPYPLLVRGGNIIVLTKI